MLEGEGFRSVGGALPVFSMLPASGGGRGGRAGGGSGAGAHFAGELVFDATDSISVGPGTRVRVEDPGAPPLRLSSFRTLRPEDAATVRAWRTDPAKRKALAEACVSEGWGDEMLENVVPPSLARALGCSADEVMEILTQLYPNAAAPSDHPPCISPPFVVLSS